MSKPTPLKKDGYTVAILRPMDPAAVVSKTNEILFHQSQGKLSPEEAAAALDEVGKDQERTFVGVVTTDEQLMDPDTGKLIEGESIQPGDIFVSYEELCAAMMD